jgi:hypothetical protein
VATVRESLTVQREGSRSLQRRVEFYNLDVIISVGYRVKSHRGLRKAVTKNNEAQSTTP